MWQPKTSESTARTVPSVAGGVSDECPIVYRKWTQAFPTGN